ncbi:MAG: hypothetical protein IPK82_19310 [Polyangiaceae bacterium]|nr:hypothetical protein [Polyangiaceae bacterium]
MFINHLLPRAGLFAAFYCCACSGTSPQEPTIFVPQASLTASAIAEDSAPTPGEVGCEYKGPFAYGRESNIPLCFSIDSGCFANARSPFAKDLTVTFYQGDATKKGAKITLSAHGVTLSAWTPANAVLLHPKGPIVFDRMVMPLSGRAFEVTRVTGERLELKLVPPATFTALQTPFAAKVRCDELSFEENHSLPSAAPIALGFTPSSLSWRSLEPRHLVTLSPEKNSPARLDQIAWDSGEALMVAEETPTHSHVLWYHGDLVLAGFFATAPLASHTPEVQASLPFIHKTPFVPFLPSRGMTCQTALPLSAKLFDTVEQVGTIPAGTAFDFDGPTQDARYMQVRLRSPLLSVAEGAAWVVPLPLVRDCKVK